MKGECRSCGSELSKGASGFCPRCLFGTAIAELAESGEERVPTWEEMGEYLEGFSFEGELGRGGSGVVFLAREKKGGGQVAVKVLNPALAKNPELAERFRREAQVMSKLDHSRVVAVKAYGEQKGLLFLVMEFVSGGDVARLIEKEEKLAVERALELMKMACEGLAYSHGKGILHRDIKPGNLLLDSEGGLKVSDFGLAKILGEDSEVGLTMTNAKMGTPRYMAPEQMKEGGIVDERTDVYSLGVVFYELLTGRPPGGSFALPSELSEVGEAVDEVVLKAMSDEPGERYASIVEFEAALESLEKRGRKTGLRVLLFALSAVAVLGGVFLCGNPSAKGGALEGFDWVLVPREEQTFPQGFPRRLQKVHTVVVSDSAREFGVALRADGSLQGFGADNYGQASPPSGGDFIEVAVGRGERAAHALALREDGTLVAWGDNSFGQAAVPNNIKEVEAIMVGEFWSAAKVEGTWRLWGKSEEVDLEKEAGKNRVEGRTVRVRKQ